MGYCGIFQKVISSLNILISEALSDSKNNEIKYKNISESSHFPTLNHFGTAPFASLDVDGTFGEFAFRLLAAL